MNRQYKILLVDDEKDILEFLKYNFEKENYTVITAKNGLEAIDISKKEFPDLIVLDVMMPGLDGIDTCRAIRELPEFKSTIIIFLTARSEEYSEIAGFAAGANDYVAKPIRFRSFAARVKALLKRTTEANTTNQVITLFEKIIIDTERRIVVIQNEDIYLPKKEFELLVLLSSTPRKVFTREEIFLTIWGQDAVIGDRTIDVHIRKLREKIGSDFIKTSKGVGYSFDAKQLN